MHSRDAECEQNWLTGKFSKDLQRTAPPHAHMKFDVEFVLQWHENKQLTAE